MLTIFSNNNKFYFFILWNSILGILSMWYKLIRNIKASLLVWFILKLLHLFKITNSLSPVARTHEMYAYSLCDYIHNYFILFITNWVITSLLLSFVRWFPLWFWLENSQLVGLKTRIGIQLIFTLPYWILCPVMSTTSVVKIWILPNWTPPTSVKSLCHWVSPVTDFMKGLSRSWYTSPITTYFLIIGLSAASHYLSLSIVFLSLFSHTSILLDT